MKVCCGCKKEKELVEFNRANGGYGYGKEYYPYCKECCALKAYAKKLLCKELNLPTSEWKYKFPEHKRTKMIEDKYLELLKSPPVLDRYINPTDNFNPNKTQICGACLIEKRLTEFNKAVGPNGRHKFCVQCHRLRHKAETVTANESGLSISQWYKTIPKKERLLKLNEHFQRLVAESLNQTIVVSSHSPYVSKFPEFEPILEDLRKKTKRELAKLNNKQTDIAEGFIYIICNPTWPDCVKVGKAVDYESRLGNFQTGDPHRLYSVEYVQFFDNRLIAEKNTHSILKPFKVPGSDEWFKTSIDHAKSVIDSVYLGTLNVSPFGMGT